MEQPDRTDAPQRPSLDRQRIVNAAIVLADEQGLDALSMRRLAARLDVEAMSLYHHVPNKESLLDGMVDAVFSEIEIPAAADDWQDAMRGRARSARAALQRHPWAVGLLDSRAHPGPATLAHHDAVLGCLRSAGFSVPLAAHAFAVIDSFLYGFAIQEHALPFQGPAELEGVAEDILASMPTDTYPHLTELMVEHALQPGYDFGAEFEYGLELVLSGLEDARRREGPRGRSRAGPSRRS